MSNESVSLRFEWNVALLGRDVRIISLLECLSFKDFGQSLILGKLHIKGVLTFEELQVNKVKSNVGIQLLVLAIEEVVGPVVSVMMELIVGFGTLVVLVVELLHVSLFLALSF